MIVDRDKVNIKITDRLDRGYSLEGYHGQPFRLFLLNNYIPASSILLKINGQIRDDQSYTINKLDDIELKMVRAYQLPEYCQMLELWGNLNPVYVSNDSVYTNKILWFNQSGICNLKSSSIEKLEYTSWLENKFVDSILISKIIEKNDLICLPLSGGRDSLALLYLLERSRTRLPPFSVVGVTVAPTVASLEDLDIAKDAIKKLGIKEYFILDAEYVKKTMNFKSDFSVVLEKALSGSGRGVSISIWHNIMKACIEAFCRENKINKIAYGYQHEDLISSLLRSNLLGVLFGETMQQKTLGDFNLIFPLWSITKKELTIYLELIAPQRHTAQSNPTQYDRGDHNRDIHYFLADMLSTLYPGIGFSLFKAYADFNQKYVKKENFCSCRNCNSTFPQSLEHNSELCFACNYFQQINELH